MAISARVLSGVRISHDDRERLSELGLALTAPDQTAADTAVVSIMDRGSATEAVWQQLTTQRPESSTGRSPLTVVVLPATAAPRPGPVAVLTPPGGSSSYELAVGAGFAAATGKRVEHLNGRGHAGSAVHSSLPARMNLRRTAPDWRERAAVRPERVLHELTVRPSVIVIPVITDLADAQRIIAAHPDADVALVFDHLRADVGADLSGQISTMVELALDVSLTSTQQHSVPASTRVVPRDHSPSNGVPAVRASDVVHVRLTDTALELTNRTLQRVRIDVVLGSSSEAERGRVRFAATLEPGEAQRVSTDGVPELAGLASPTAVMRHWSHTHAEVYEGGERRIVGVGLTVVGPQGEAHATGRYDAPNGLDFAITARDLSALVGQASSPPLPEPEAQHATTITGDVFAALESALHVAEQLLASRATG